MGGRGIVDWFGLLPDMNNFFFLSFFIGNQLLQTMSQFAESYNTICNVS
jgi:hypothetical protein